MVSSPHHLLPPFIPTVSTAEATTISTHQGVGMVVGVGGRGRVRLLLVISFTGIAWHRRCCVSR